MWKRLVLLIVSILVAWGGLEVGLRQFGARVDPAAQNEWIGCVGWAGQPHQVQKYFTDEFITTERINSAGLPDVEHTYAKPANVFRILFVGDSFIEGYQVDLEESFPRLLEGKMNAGRAVGALVYEVIKAGYRAWGTDQAWQYYACEGYRYQADLVIYAFTANDVMDNSLHLKAQMANWDPEAPPKPYYTLGEDGQLVVHNFPYPVAPAEVQPHSVRDVLYKYLVSYRIAEKGWQSLQLRLAQQRPEPPTIEVNRYSRHVIHYTMPVYLEPPPPEYDEAWRLTEALVPAFAADVRQHGSEFAIFSNGLPWSVEPGMQRELVLDDPFFEGWLVDWDYPDHRLAEQAEGGLSAPFVALAPGFRAAAGALAQGDSYFFREGHYNQAGHRLAAELLYDWLVGEGLVQEAASGGE